MVALTMVGSPCETFSEARHTPPPEGDTSRWPRPLRSKEWYFGLHDLNVRELLQTHAGTNFWLQGLRGLGAHLAWGGVFMSEHPDLPRLPERASTWTAGLTELLRSHADVRLYHVQQWRWGAKAIKPTGLLAYATCRRPCALCNEEPILVLPSRLRRHSSGAFRTSSLKEYPVQFSYALACAFTDRIKEELRAGRWRRAPQWEDLPQGQILRDWVAGAAEAGRHIYAEASCLPDYQPR
eukprot:s2897_g8.t1